MIKTTKSLLVATVFALSGFLFLTIPDTVFADTPNETQSQRQLEHLANSWKNVQEEKEIAERKHNDQKVQRLEHVQDEIEENVLEILNQYQQVDELIVVELSSHYEPQRKNSIFNYEIRGTHTGCDTNTDSYNLTGEIPTGRNQFTINWMFPVDFSSGTYPDCITHQWDDNLYLHTDLWFSDIACAANFITSNQGSDLAICEPITFSDGQIWTFTVRGDYQNGHSIQNSKTLWLVFP